MKSYGNAMNHGGLVGNARGYFEVWNRIRFSALFLFLAPLLFFQFGCQPRSDRWEPGKGFKTQIIVTRSFGTEFQQVELNGVMDKSTLSGEIADFYFSPGDENGSLVGNKALARFIEDDGVHIPADQISLQMVTLYYHLQQLKKLESDALQSEVSIVTWPRKVALAVQVKNAPDMRYDNAFYNGKVDALYFVPYKESGFPIPLNPGIVAHEHFHSYFSYEVLNPLMAEGHLPKNFVETETDEQKFLDQLYNIYVLKIINEGLADVWGWIYSKDPDFVVVSLPKTGTTRNLEKNTVSSRVVDEQGLRREIQNILNHCVRQEQKCVGDNAYGHGTLLARSLKAFAADRKKSQNFSEEAVRTMMAGKILNLIVSLRKSFSENKSVNLDQVLSLWIKQFDSISDTECETLQKAASSAGVVKCSSNAVLLAQ